MRYIARDVYTILDFLNGLVKNEWILVIFGI